MARNCCVPRSERTEERTSPKAADHVYQEADQFDAGTSTAHIVDEAGANAAVAAYRSSAKAGKPLSERKLAAMFDRTSRRWARNRIAEAGPTGSPVPDERLARRRRWTPDQL